MSIAPARKVSSSSPTARMEKNYAVGAQNEQIVENIDTNNSVLVKDDSERESFSGHLPYQQQENEEKKPITPSSAYVSNSLEALAGSGVYETPEAVADNSGKVGVYGNNQAIIKDEELDRTGRSYLKHFYEKNQHIEELDEFI